MRKPRAFRPACDSLESRMVPSPVSVAMRSAKAAVASFHPPLQLNNPFAHTISPGPFAVGAVVSSSSSPAHQATTPSRGVGSITTNTGFTPTPGMISGLSFTNARPGLISGLSFTNATPGLISGLSFTSIR